jgi:hypothetical protein
MLSPVKKSQATKLAAWARRNSRQHGPDRRGAGSSFACASSRRTLVGRDVQAELGQLAADPPMAPARVLARKPQHQLTNLSRQRRPTALTGRLSPPPAYQHAMPPQHRARSHKKPGTRQAWQAADCGRKKLPDQPL